MARKNQLNNNNWIIITLVAAVLGIIQFVLFLSKELNLKELFYPINNRMLSFGDEALLSYLSFFQCFLLILALFFHKKFLSSLLKTKVRCSFARYNYVKFWSAITIIISSWLLIYLWLGLAWSKILTNEFIKDSRLVWTVVDIIHGITIIGFFLAYLRLKYPIRTESEKSVISKIFLRKKRLLIGVVFTILIFAVFGRFYFDDFSKLGVLLLAVLSAFSMQFFISGLMNIGHLSNTTLIIPLYLYVQLQIIWVAVDGITHVYSQALIIIIALVCKIFFFLILFKWEKENRFYNNFKKLHL